jgi:hypothetical protein
MLELALAGQYAAYVSYWPWFFSGGLLFALISWFVGNTKGHGCLGCILGGLLGPFGLLITALLGPRNSA